THTHTGLNHRQTQSLFISMKLLCALMSTHTTHPHTHTREMPGLALTNMPVTPPKTLFTARVEHARHHAHTHTHTPHTHHYTHTPTHTPPTHTHQHHTLTHRQRTPDTHTRAAHTHTPPHTQPTHPSHKHTATDKPSLSLAHTRSHAV